LKKEKKLCTIQKKAVPLRRVSCKIPELWWEDKFYLAIIHGIVVQNASRVLGARQVGCNDV